MYERPFVDTYNYALLLNNTVLHRKSTKIEMFRTVFSYIKCRHLIYLRIVFVINLIFLHIFSDSPLFCLNAGLSANFLLPV